MVTYKMEPSVLISTNAKMEVPIATNMLTVLILKALTGECTNAIKLLDKISLYFSI